MGSALRGAAARAGRLLPWAAVSATVSLLLRAIEERAGVLGKIVSGIAGMAWALVTFLVLPILVMEDIGVRDALRRSAEMFKGTWGENVAARIGFGLLGFLRRAARHRRHRRGFRPRLHRRHRLRHHQRGGATPCSSPSAWCGSWWRPWCSPP